ncbi:MAG: methyltransferase domain-containing protein [Oricola sp.]
MIKVYDRTMRGSHQRRYYGESGYYNFGYWAKGARTQGEACEALVDELSAGLPDKGRILDVACGLGASTRRLGEKHGPANITGINISAKQIADARQRAPSSEFAVMDATRLDFPDNHFDAVVCVEAAFHFDTRAAFLAEALRVLKPGGVLVLSDILLRAVPDWFAAAGQVPPANLVASVEEYRAGLEGAGFTDVEIRDETDACLNSFRRSLVAWPGAEYRAGRSKLDRRIATELVCRLVSGYFGLVCRTYLLVSAKKPA